MRNTIIQRALKCIDEIYPDDNSFNAFSFPLDDFIDDAARRILLAVPLHALGDGVDLRSNASVSPNGDGSGRIALPVDFLRLIRLRMEGWQRPVIAPIRQTDPAYKKQFSRITRGGTVKPVAALCDGDSALEYFSLPNGAQHAIAEGRYFGFTGVDASYPASLEDITAWQLAALVLSSIDSPQAATMAQGRVNEMIPLL